MRLAWGFRPPSIHNLPTNLSETPKESLWIHAHLPPVVETNRAVHLGLIRTESSIRVHKIHGLWDPMELNDEKFLEGRNI